MAYASKVIIVPGYGWLPRRPSTRQPNWPRCSPNTPRRGSSPSTVAGRMPGHMNVLLAEANVPYTDLKEMDAANLQFQQRPTSTKKKKKNRHRSVLTVFLLSFLLCALLNRCKQLVERIGEKLYAVIGQFVRDLFHRNACFRQIVHRFSLRPQIFRQTIPAAFRDRGTRRLWQEASCSPCRAQSILRRR